MGAESVYAHCLLCFGMRGDGGVNGGIGREVGLGWGDEADCCAVLCRLGVKYHGDVSDCELGRSRGIRAMLGKGI